MLEVNVEVPELIFAASDVGYILVKEAIEDFAECWYCTLKGSQNHLLGSAKCMISHNTLIPSFFIMLVW